MRDTVKFPTAGWLAQYIYRQARRLETNEATVLSVSDLGTLVDVTLPDGFDLAERNFLELEAIRLLDGTRVLMVSHDLSLIPDSLVIAMYALLALELMAFAWLGSWVMYHRNRKLVRNSSPLFMLQVLFGACIMSLTVIPLAQQDNFLVPRGMTLDELELSVEWLNASCVAGPVLFSLGFFITFSALFLKSWRLFRIFNNKKLRNLFLRDRQLLAYQCLVIFVVVALNLLWALRDPLIWKRFPVFIDTATNLVVSSYGVCYSRTGVGPAIPLAVGIMLVLGLGNYLSYLGRRIPTEFNESKWTAMAMVMTLEAFCIGLPILILANSQPIPGFIIKSLSSLLVSGATVGLIFVPKVAMAYGWGLIEGESNPWRFVKESGSGSQGAQKRTGSKENEGTAVNICTNKSHNPAKAIQPSLNSLVEGKATLMSVDNKFGTQAINPVFSSEALGRSKPNVLARVGSKDLSKDKRSSKELVGGGTTSEVLTRVLQDDPMRRRFRRYLQTLKMEENVRFWDSVVIFRTEIDEYRRFVSARAIVQTFVLDTSPLQVNLSSKTRSAILAAFERNDKQVLGSIDFFNAATNELFEDLRQSDAFRKFLENDTFSHDVLGSKSDPTVE